MKGILARISMHDIHEIESVTEKQSESELWHKARCACVTASTCYDVMTRMKSLDKDETKTSENIVKQFLITEMLEQKQWKWVKDGKRWLFTNMNK